MDDHKCILLVQLQNLYDTVQLKENKKQKLWNWTRQSRAHAHNMTLPATNYQVWYNLTKKK